MAVFNDLPAELRTIIWELCLPDPETPEIYFFDPSDFDYQADASDASDASNTDSEWEAEPEVLTGFPVIMHLCRESRKYAQAHLSFREEQITITPTPTPTRTRTRTPSPTRTQTQTRTQTLDLPCRPYRPATDIIFVRDFSAFSRISVASMNVVHQASMAAVPVAEPPKVFSEEVAHLAVDAALFASDVQDEFEYHIPQMTALRRFSIIFHRVRPAAGAKDKRPSPSHRCKLVPYTERRGLMVPGRKSSVVEVEDFLGNLEQESSLWELVDEDKAPWNSWSGEWLFDTVGVEMVRASGIV